jgi:hypothetical protein
MITNNLLKNNKITCFFYTRDIALCNGQAGDDNGAPCVCVCECSGGDTVGVVGHTHCVHVYAHYITRAAARTLMILRTNRFCTVSLDSPVYFVCTRD